MTHFQPFSPSTLTQGWPGKQKQPHSVMPHSLRGFFNLCFASRIFPAGHIILLLWTKTYHLKSLVMFNLLCHLLFSTLFYGHLCTCFFCLTISFKRQSIMIHPCTPKSEQKAHQNCPTKIWGITERPKVPNVYKINLENTAYGEIGPELVKKLWNLVCTGSSMHTWW